MTPYSRRRYEMRKDGGESQDVEAPRAVLFVRGTAAVSTSLEVRTRDPGPRLHDPLGLLTGRPSVLGRFGWSWASGWAFSGLGGWGAAGPEREARRPAKGAPDLWAFNQTWEENDTAFSSRDMGHGGVEVGEVDSLPNAETGRRDGGHPSIHPPSPLPYPESLADEVLGAVAAAPAKPNTMERVGTAHVPDSWAPLPPSSSAAPAALASALPPPALPTLMPVLFAGADAYVIHRDMRMELASTRRKPRPGPFFGRAGQGHMHTRLRGREEACDTSVTVQATKHPTARLDPKCASLPLRRLRNIPRSSSASTTVDEPWIPSPPLSSRLEECCADNISSADLPVRPQQPVAETRQPAAAAATTQGIGAGRHTTEREEILRIKCQLPATTPLVLPQAALQTPPFPPTLDAALTRPRIQYLGQQSTAPALSPPSERKKRKIGEPWIAASPVQQPRLPNAHGAAHNQTEW
ncbi:hypothetical protein Purlil1_7513 [Purpureocillium lilacinum]|uniref:Uncharacterized protein n=1 Tax=Purpureocillium lilacinum TaxID=33203 RepID=A0ABR0BVA6_PURLI|nr:hypothetical protein Purlil1_7513 [Purpureocillium lilacinum]